MIRTRLLLLPLAAGASAALLAVPGVPAVPAVPAASAATPIPAASLAGTGPHARPPAAGLAAAPAGDTLVDLAVGAGTFETLVAALRAAGLVEALSGDGPWTVFAPTDAAFAKLDPARLAELLEPENVAALRTVLTYHVVPGALAAADVVRLPETRALNGQRLPIELDRDSLRVAGATVVQADLRASNGIVHAVDSVLLPSTADLVDTAVAAGQFGTLAKALGAAGLVDALKGEGPFTVFAPTDAAFAKLDPAALAALLEPANREQLAGILGLHIVPGRLSAREAIAAGVSDTLQGSALRFAIVDGQLFVGGARVVRSDVESTNGVIHVIDTVLRPE